MSSGSESHRGRARPPQKWTEGRGRILVFTPANVRKQWSQEMKEISFLRTIILEEKNYDKLAKSDVRHPSSRSRW
jgi:hypothetical protein